MQTRHSPRGIYVRCEKCGKAQPGEVMARDLERLGALQPIKEERETRATRRKPKAKPSAPRTKVGAPAPPPAPKPRAKKQAVPKPPAQTSPPTAGLAAGGRGFLRGLFAG